MANIFTSSIGRKFAMALSALFLMIFLTMHVSINLISVFSADAFNEASHFMGYNFFIQFLMQPILIAGVFFHFIMGFILEIKNKNARGTQGYSYSSNNANSSWLSRNMIWSGLAILAFMGLHLYDFWMHEITYKYILKNAVDSSRYYPELVAKFHNQPLRVGLYVISFIFLMMHLLHGFQSAFQSIGFNHRKYSSFIKKFGYGFAVIVPILFIFIAVFHFINS